MSETKVKMHYADAMDRAERIKKELEPYCIRIEIAGSLRRKRPMVGDIELVALPVASKDLFGNPVGGWLLDNYLAGAGYPLSKNGQKYKQFIVDGKKIDLFLPESPDNWGAILAIRTGSSEFNKWLVTYCRTVGFFFEGGWLRRLNDRMAVTVQEEGVLFSTLSLPYIRPDLRDDNQWLRLT